MKSSFPSFLATFIPLFSFLANNQLNLIDKGGFNEIFFLGPKLLVKIMECLLVALMICTYCQSSFAGFNNNILFVLPNVEYNEFKETSKLAQQFSQQQQYNVTVLSPFTLPETDHLTHLPISGDIELVKSKLLLYFRILVKSAIFR